MKDEKENGYVVINICHPNSGRSFIVGNTFSYLRREAVAKFLEGSGNTWLFWRVEYNFRVVRAKQTLTVTI